MKDFHTEKIKTMSDNMEIDKSRNYDNKQPISDATKKKIKKPSIPYKDKTGVIYLSTIPRFMQPNTMVDIFSQYGEVGRVFLEPKSVDKAKKSRKQKKDKDYFKLYEEGWVEFKRKSVAKKVANTLNNTSIGGKKKSPWYHDLWNMKYLHRFKWHHLHEKLQYEKAVSKQRLRKEVQQAKDESEFYISKVEANKIQEGRAKRGQASKHLRDDRIWTWDQQQTEDEHLRKKMKRNDGTVSAGPSGELKVAPDPKSASGDKSFLSTMFSGGGHSDSD